MILNPGQLTHLRDNHPHAISAFITAIVPSQVYCGRIAVAPTRGDSTLTVSTESGNPANILADMQVLVSETGAGLREKSVRRIRSATANGANWDLLLDQNNVDWAIGDYLTVMLYWEPRPRLPKIDDTSPYTMYKDEDIEYGDAASDADKANSEPNPVAIMGPPWCGFLDGASVAVQLDGSDSYAVAHGATISTYLWSSTGGAIAGPNASTTYITFNAVGTYWVYLTVTDSNGKTQTRRTPFVVHSRSGSSAPYSGFMARISGNVEGGVELSFEGFDDASSWPDRTMIILWTEEFFSGTPYHIGGFNDREHVRFVGYLVSDNIGIDPENTGSLTITAVTIDQVLSRIRMSSVALLDVTREPTSWYEYKNATVARMLHHYWHWHSTLFTVADVMLPTSNTLRKGAPEFPEGSLLSQARLMSFEKGIFAQIGCNKQGTLFVETDPNMIAESDRGVIDTVMEIESDDWQEGITIVVQESPPISFAELSGVYWDGNVGTPYVSVMPGNILGSEGPDIEDRQFQMLSGQADSNEKVGLLYSKRNQKVREVRFNRLAGNYQHVDVYPQEFYELTVVASSNERGIALNARKLMPRSYSFTYKPAEGTVDVSMVCEPATIDVVDGVPGLYPSVPPFPPGDNPEPPAYPDPELAPAYLAAFSYGTGTFISKNGGSNWSARNGERTASQKNERFGYWDPWGPTTLKRGSFNPERAIYWSFGDGFIMRSIDGGRHWYNVTPSSDPPNSCGDSPAPTASDLVYCHAVPDFHRNGYHYVIAYWQNGSSEYRGWLVVTRDDGKSWEWKSLGGNASAVVGQWLFPTGYVDGVWCWADDPIVPVPGHQPPSSHEFVNTDNICEEDGNDGGARVTWNYVKQLCDTWSSLFVADLGCWITLTNAVDIGGVNVESKTGTCTDTMTWQACIPNLYADTVELLPRFGHYAGLGGTPTCPLGPVTSLLSWECFFDGYPPSNVVKDALVDAPLDKFRYILFTFSHAHDNYVGEGFQELLWDYIKLVPASVDNEVRPISISLGWQEGIKLYMTVWEGGALRLNIFEVDDDSVELRGTTKLGDASRAQIDNRTYWASCRALCDASVADYEDHVVVYGQWNDGADRWVAYSSDAGETLSFVNDGTWLNTEWVGALRWVDEDTMIICLNSGSPELWRTINKGAAWSLLSAIAHSVDNGAMAMHGGVLATIAIGDRASDDIEKQNTPYTGAWTAIDLGVAASGVGSVMWVFNERPS